MRVQMTSFGESDGRQLVIPRLGWIHIELPFSKSTRSSNKSSWIKNYDYLKLTLLFQSRDDSIKDQKRVLDRIKTSSNSSRQMHASAQPRQMHPRGACIPSVGITDARQLWRAHPLLG